MSKRKHKKRNRQPDTSSKPIVRIASWPSWVAALCIVVVGIVVYSSSLKGAFVLDDRLAIIENTDLRSAGSIWESLFPPPEPPMLARWRGPVIGLTLAINHRLGGLNPYGYHAVNVTAHILASLVLFGVVRRTLLLGGLRERVGSASVGPALAVALIWLVHPVTTDSVTYVIQRTEVIMGLFYLLTLYCVIRGCDSIRGRWWFATAVVACALGMLSKEVMVTAPVILLLFDRIFIGPSFGEVLRKRWGLYVGLAVTWGVLLWLMVLSPHVGVVGLDLGVGPWDYLKSQCGIIVHYLRLALWPTCLILDYGKAQPVALADVMGAASVLLLLLAATAVALRYRPRLAFLGVWFFVILSPTSSFLPIVTEVGAERRMYLPLIAVVALVVIGGLVLGRKLSARVMASGNRRRNTGWAVGAGLPLVIVAGFGHLTVERNRLYHDVESIWGDLLAKRPNSPRAYANLASLYAERGRLGDAADAYREVLRLDPNHPDMHFNLGSLLAIQGDYQEAAEAFRGAIGVNPRDAGAHTALANTLMTLGRSDEAISQMTEALDIDPDDPAIHISLADLLLRQGRLSEASQHYRETLRLRPSDAIARHRLELAVSKKTELDDVLHNRRAAAESQPDSPEALSQLAWLLTTHPDPAVRNADEAIRLAERAVELTGRRHARALDVLAAAYAADGQFDRAIANVEAALVVLEEAGLEKVIPRVRERLELYQQGKPYLEREWMQSPSRP